MTLLGYDHGACMRAKWGADAARAWLPLCSASSPVLKILRKGAPDFPASVRYISAQMRRACHGGEGDACGLLRDIVRTWAIGTFRGSSNGDAASRIRKAGASTHQQLFEHVVAKAKSAELHALIQNFVAGVTSDFAHLAWAMSKTVSFPYVEAVWAMLGKVVARNASSTPAEFPGGFCREIFGHPLVSAKRVKTLYTALSDTQKQGVNFYVWRRRATSAQQIRSLPVADSQQHLRDILMPHCVTCFRPTTCRVDLCRQLAICEQCGSGHIVSRGVRGVVVSDETGKLTRLCSRCGVLGAAEHTGVVGVCKKCTAMECVACVVCGKDATRYGIGGHTTVYGMCPEHAVPLHYSCSMSDILTTLRARCV